MREETPDEARMRTPLARIATLAVGGIILLLTCMRDYAWFNSSVPATPFGIVRTVLGPIIGLAIVAGALLPSRSAGRDGESENRDLRHSDDRHTL